MPSDTKSSGRARRRNIRSVLLAALLGAVVVVGILIPVAERARVVSQGATEWCPQLESSSVSGGSADSYSMSVVPFGITCVYDGSDDQATRVSVYHDLGTAPGLIAVLGAIGLVIVLARRPTSRIDQPE